MPGKGFFKVFFSVCSGMSDIPELCTYSMMQTVRYCLTLIILLSLLTGIISGVSAHYDLQNTVRDFTIAFGGSLRLTEVGVTPQRDPDLARSLELPGNGRLFYAGIKPRQQGKPKDLAGLDYFIYWQAGFQSVAVREDKETWAVSRFGENVAMTRITGSEAALKRILESPEERRWNWNGLTEISVSSIFSVIVWLTGLTFFIKQFILSTVLMFLTTGVFTLVFSATSGNHLTGGVMLWKSGLYAAFPAAVISCVYGLLELPFFSVGTIFVAGLFLYWMQVIPVVEKSLRDKEKGA